MEKYFGLYSHPYMLTGAVVSILLLKKLATSIANSPNVWTGTHWSSGTRTNKVKPSIGHYMGALVWSIILIPLWPIRVLFQLWLLTIK